MFQRIAVAANPQNPQAVEEADLIARFLNRRGVKAVAGRMYDEALLTGLQNGAFDLWLALGGDGTMLRAGHLCAPVDVPILGINLGRLGFLIEIQRSDWASALERLLAGESWLETRMMLHARHCRAGETLAAWHVINEIAVGRGATMRPVRVSASVDEILLATYLADGLIAATATGSTAYALAAGGPILPPELRNILLVPVAPHMSVDRAIVLAEGSRVTIHLDVGHQAVLSADGQPPAMLEDGDDIAVAASQFSVRFVRLQDRGYFYRNLTSQINAFRDQR